MDELAFADASTLAAKIRAKDISSVELLAHYVARMGRYNPEINAIVVTQLDKAQARAQAADAALARGESWGLCRCWSRCEARDWARGWARCCTKHCARCWIRHVARHKSRGWTW